MVGSIWRSVVLAAWMAISLYVGVGGWLKADFNNVVQKLAAADSVDGEGVVYGGVHYGSLEQALGSLKKKEISSWFPWVFVIPDFLGLVLAAMAFGLLGGTASVLSRVAIHREELSDQLVVSRPVFGSLVGLLVLAMSYLVPVALVRADDVQLQPTMILFLCMFGGAFSTRAYQWLESQTDKLLGSPKEG